MNKILNSGESPGFLASGRSGRKCHFPPLGSGQPKQQPSVHQFRAAQPGGHQGTRPHGHSRYPAQHCWGSGAQGPLADEAGVTVVSAHCCGQLGEANSFRLSATPGLALGSGCGCVRPLPSLGFNVSICLMGMIAPLSGSQNWLCGLQASGQGGNLGPLQMELRIPSWKSRAGTGFHVAARGTEQEGGCSCSSGSAALDCPVPSRPQFSCLSSVQQWAAGL